MSDVDFLAKLLDGVAVGWKTLGELTLPTSNIKWKEANRSYKYIDLTSVSIETKAILESSEINKISAPSRAQKLVEKDDVLFATTRPTQLRYCLIDDAYHGEIASTGYCVLRAKTSEVLPKWIWHWMGSAAFKEYLEECQSGSAYPAVSDAKVKDFKIPIPCPENPQESLEIQSEIVTVLDDLTKLTAELTADLTAELTARKLQYKHYRDQLLSFSRGDAEWKALGDIGQFIRGKRFTKADFVDDGIDAIHYGEIYTRYGAWTNRAFTKVRSDMKKSLRFALPGDVIMTGVGETVDDVGKAVAWIGKGNVAIHDDSYAFRHAMNPKFIAYAMQTNAFIDQKAKHVSRGKVNRLLVDGIAKVEIPVPFPGDPEKSLAEQARIVDILDKFDALANSLAEGLTREIELRQKQYAYYRELLLNFPKPEALEA